jgi:2-keto-4-pentenoate hydratase/2-oxohepta-3-ene-1,7-dioic acid hydratase in catechol pathway
MLRLRLLSNGQVMQDGTNEDWVFPLPRLLSRLSSAMTLEPCSRGNRARAQVVTTGTPAGVGFSAIPRCS